MSVQHPAMLTPALHSLAGMATPLTAADTLAANVALMLVGGGLLALASWSLLRCRHEHELFDRFPDGRPALRCRNCLQLRPNILGQPVPHFHAAQPAAPRVSFAVAITSGIERQWAELDFPITDADLFDCAPAPYEPVRQ